MQNRVYIFGIWYFPRSSSERKFAEASPAGTTFRSFRARKISRLFFTPTLVHKYIHTDTNTRLHTTECLLSARKRLYSANGAATAWHGMARRGVFSEMLRAPVMANFLPLCLCLSFFLSLSLFSLMSTALTLASQLPALICDSLSR